MLQTEYLNLFSEFQVKDLLILPTVIVLTKCFKSGLKNSFELKKWLSSEICQLNLYSLEVYCTLILRNKFPNSFIIS